MASAGALSGKRVLVTGGAKRIGRAIALAAARAGADVAITYLESEDSAQQTAKEIDAAGVRGLVVKCDVREPDSVSAAAEKVIQEFGGLDVLVNNAGRFKTAKFEEITIAQWDDIFATDVRGPFLLSQTLAPELRKSGGRIINIGSLGGIRPWATHAHYCSAKAALHMLTQSMAKALAPEIAVNCIAPGMIEMDRTEPSEMAIHFAGKTPMKTTGTAEEVAAAALFFATAPKFITGQIFAVDGGLGLI